MTDVIRVRSLIEAGLTHAAIATAMGWKTHQVNTFCRKHGIASTRHRKLPPWPQLALELMSAPQHVVASRYGVSSTAITEARRRAEKTSLQDLQQVAEA